MKIGLMYLDVTNLGDVIIYETSKYLIDRIISDDNMTDIEIVPIPIDCSADKFKPNFFTRLRYLCFRIRNKVFSIDYKKCSEETTLKYWYRTPAYQCFNKVVKPKIESSDKLVFSGGGLIKFHRQNFHLLIHEIVKVASNNNIPIYFSAVGIEGYDIADARCRILKNAINNKIVKSISTRDDIESLNSNYINNDNIKTLLVADSAFWIKETYNIHPKKTSDKNVGLSLIRPDIFREYLYDVSEDALTKLYRDLILLLLTNNYKVTLFTNGSKRDTNYLNNFVSLNPDLAINIEERYMTAKDLVNGINKFDMIITARLHASIISFSLNIPCIGLVWNTKQLLLGRT